MCENEKKETDRERKKQPSGQKIFLVGIGMGSKEGLTVRALETVVRCPCLIGAQRMLEAARSLPEVQALVGTSGEKVYCEAHLAEDILSCIKEQKEYKEIGVLFSGDTGFYSGAKRLAGLLEEAPQAYDVELAPGISSAAYLAARLKTSWEDASIVSLHGREGNFVQTISRSRKTFLLLGGRDTGAGLLRRLREYGMDDVTVSLGSRLSYPDERICTGRPTELRDEDAQGLCAALVVNPRPENRADCHVRDDDFIRGKVPMTKEEVRAISLARLALTQDAVVYDIGAGTGSVSVEAARCGDRIRVYAVEKNPLALELLEQNRRKFRADGIRIAAGEAPEALRELEAPTHVFIGGSAGRLKEILKTVREKNPQVRIVINAVSMETVKEIVDAGQEGLLPGMEITQLSAARSKELGGYHMMTGMNPVYIVSAGGGA